MEEEMWPESYPLSHQEKNATLEDVKERVITNFRILDPSDNMVLPTLKRLAKGDLRVVGSVASLQGPAALPMQCGFWEIKHPGFKVSFFPMTIELTDITIGGSSQYRGGEPTVWMTTPRFRYACHDAHLSYVSLWSRAHALLQKKCRQNNEPAPMVYKDIEPSSTMPHWWPTSEAALWKTFCEVGVLQLDGPVPTGKDLTLIASFGRQQLTQDDMDRMEPGELLNDEVINFYGAIVRDRCERAEAPALNIYIFNTFFYFKLHNRGYDKSRVGLWTRQVDIFTMDRIIIPINRNNVHWGCALIDFRSKRIQYYDSMRWSGAEIFSTLRVYLQRQHLATRKTPFDLTGWENYVDESAPKQNGGNDCGVFVCQFVKCASQDIPHKYTQDQMKILRAQMVAEMTQGRILEGTPT